MSEDCAQCDFNVDYNKMSLVGSLAGMIGFSIHALNNAWGKFSVGVASLREAHYVLCGYAGEVQSHSYTIAQSNNQHKCPHLICGRNALTHIKYTYMVCYAIKIR